VGLAAAAKHVEPLPLDIIRPQDVSIVRYHVPGGAHSKSGLLTEINHAAYAKRHGYHLGADKVSETSFESVMHLVDPAAWIKVPLMLAAIDPRVSGVAPSELVIWVDADVVFTSPEVELTSLLANLVPEGSSKSVIMARDLGNNIVNGGVIIVRRSEWSVAFLRRLLETSRNETTRRSGYWEQDAIKVLYDANEFGERDNILVIEERHLLNAFTKRREWRHGDFIAHHTQCPFHEDFGVTHDECEKLFRLFICTSTPLDDPLVRNFCAPITAPELPPPQLSLLLESATNVAWPWPTEIMGTINDVPAEVKFYAASAKLPGVTRLCEVGFAKGHSAITMLWSNPESTLVSFDLEDLEYAQRSLEYVKKLFPNRVNRVAGDSLVSLSAHATSLGDNPEICDLFSIDGVHEGDYPRQDLRYALKMTKPGGYLIADDVSPKSFPKVVSAWEALKTTGEITDVHCEEHPVAIEGYQKRWCIGTVV
jgi:predicted O-methyltransferase YrrM